MAFKSENEGIGNGGFGGNSSAFRNRGGGFGRSPSLAGGGIDNGHQHIPPQAARGGGATAAAGLGGQGEWMNAACHFFSFFFS